VAHAVAMTTSAIWALLATPLPRLFMDGLSPRGDELSTRASVDTDVRLPLQRSVMTSPSKLLGSMDREVRALVASVDEYATQLMAVHKGTGLTVARAPERFVLQTGNVGVSVSIFRSRAGADVGAEVVLSIWDGEVTLPGRAPKPGTRAKEVNSRQFQLVMSDDTSLVWTDDAKTMSTGMLAATCIGTMADLIAATPAGAPVA
jgi:hypothetical protein